MDAARLFDQGNTPLEPARVTIYAFRKPCDCRAAAVTLHNRWLIHQMTPGFVVRLRENDPPHCMKCQRLWQQEGMEVL